MLAKFKQISFLAFLGCLIWLNASHADNPKNYIEKQTKALRAPVYEGLMEAQELMEASQYKQAVQVLDGLKRRTGKRALQDHEKVQLYNFYAFVYLGEANYPKAITAFEDVLKQKQLTLAVARSTKLTLGQLYLTTGKPAKAIQMFNDWFDITDKPTPETYVLLAQAYLQNKQINKALPPLLKGFDLAKKQGKTPKENWYSLLQYIYAEKKDFKKQRNALEVLVNNWPKKSYWLALVGVYSELDQEKEQLYAMESAYLQGMLDKESYLVTLAQMLAAEGAPYEAAKIMQKGFKDKLIEPTAKNLERIADYWRRAQETNKAIPYQVRAAKLAKGGEASLRLAGMYLTQYEESKAVDAINQALKKGDLKDSLQAKMLLGQASFQAARFDQAEKAFDDIIAMAKADKKATDKKLKRMGDIATQWKSYMQNEIKRQAEIKKYLKS